jgi:hypothetical protein
VGRVVGNTVLGRGKGEGEQADRELGPNDVLLFFLSFYFLLSIFFSPISLIFKSLFQNSDFKFGTQHPTLQNIQYGAKL